MKKMKIPTLVLTLIFIFLTSSMCLAFIPEEECSIAGIRPGDDYQRVLDCYGTPLKMEKNKRGEKYIARIEYNGVIILCESKGSKDPVVRVTNIIVQKNNGWKTPSGIGVGTDFSVVEELYGYPSDVDTIDGCRTYSNKIKAPLYSSYCFHIYESKGKIYRISLSGHL